MSVITRTESVPLDERATYKEENSKWNYSIAKYVTILNWLPKYSRLDGLSDFVAGFSLGLTLIPQSIAYAALAGLTAQYGLYSCLMGNFLYLLLGTIKEVSIGPSSLMSLLTLEYTRNMPVDFIVLFCFISGCVELLMGMLRLGLYQQHSFLIMLILFILTISKYSHTYINNGTLGHCYEEQKSFDNFLTERIPYSFKYTSSLAYTFHLSKVANISFQMTFLNHCICFLVDFISMPVTSGFTSATSIIIIISQLQGLLGLKFKAHNSIDNLLKILKNLKNIRAADFILGLCSIAFLLFFRQLKDMDCCFGKDSSQMNRNDRRKYLKKFLWFLSICRNALAILITSAIALYSEKNGSSLFTLSGKIEAGLPRFSLPPFSSQVGNQTYTFLDMCRHYGLGIIIVPFVAVLANVAIAKAFACGSGVNATQEMLTLGLCNIFGSFVSSMPTAGAFTRSAVVSASGVRTPMSGIYVGTMTLLALSFLTPYFYYIPRSTLAAVLISAVVFMIDFKLIRLLWEGCKNDALAALVTLSVSIMFGVELGLLIGALFSLIFFLRPSVRPQIEVIQCKTQLGNKYIILKPDNGLLYPAANYFCNKIMEITRKYDENNVPFIIDCERVRNMDYTAIKSIELISANINIEKKKLWFLNVSLETFNSIKNLANHKYFHFIDDKDKISSIFHDGLLISNVGERKEQHLENITFTSVNDNKNDSETLPKLIAKSEDDSEEIALMSSASQETKLK